MCNTRQKLTRRYRRFVPPPRCQDVILPWLLRPPVLRRPSVSGRYGRPAHRFSLAVMMRPLKPAHPSKCVVGAARLEGLCLAACPDTPACSVTSRHAAGSDWESLTRTPGVVGLYTFKPALVVLCLVCCRFCHHSCTLRSPAAVSRHVVRDGKMLQTKNRLGSSCVGASEW